MRRRTFLASAPLIWTERLRPRAPARPVNLLMITVDDMNWDSVGAFGCKLPGVTPNIDRLAAEGMRFLRAHVTVAVCQPSRSVWMTGRYPHRNGAEGFGPIRRDTPTLQEQLHAAGYLNGILGKNEHLAPREKFCWDFHVTADELGDGRSPALYYARTKEFLQVAARERRPFFLMANAHDPHRPFAGSQQELKRYGKHLEFPRRFEASQAPVPPFLPDIGAVREELAQYYASVYRADQTTGEVLRALAESGFEQDTLVMFLSDNGMAFPFAKTNCYPQSTRTPWIVRWPGRLKAGAVEPQHFISGIDFMPTVLEALNLPGVEGMDGRSFLALLKGERQPGRDQVVTVFHETSARQRYEMRCLQNGRFAYIFNAWSDGKTIFRNESQSGLSFAAMQQAGRSDARIAERVRFFLYRAPEELYDLQKDPCCLHNLIEDRSYRQPLLRLRAQLLAWMRQTADRLVSSFQEVAARA